MKIAYAVVGPDWVVHVFCEAFAPGDQVEIRQRVGPPTSDWLHPFATSPEKPSEIRPRVAPGEEWKSLQGYTLPELLSEAAAMESTISGDLWLAAEHFRRRWSVDTTPAAPEGIWSAMDPSPAEKSAPEVPSALPREVVCSAPSAMARQQAEGRDPRPAYPPSSQNQLGEEGLRTDALLVLAMIKAGAPRAQFEPMLEEAIRKAMTGETEIAPGCGTYQQWANRVETLERGRDAAMGRAQRATQERDAAVERAAGMERAAEQWKKSAFRMQELLNLLQDDSPKAQTALLARQFQFEDALFDAQQKLTEEEGANILNRAALKNTKRERDLATKALRDLLTAYQGTAEYQADIAEQAERVLGLPVAPVVCERSAVAHAPNSHPETCAFTRYCTRPTPASTKVTHE